MDSPDKAPAPVGAEWRYDWIEKIEEDRSCYVVAGNAKASKKREVPDGRDTVTTVAFENIIKAMYRQPYKLTSTEILKDMTEQADFYCCLPVVSDSLYAAFYRSPHFLANINKDREILLALAYKLRHLELFNDCIILISGHGPPEKPRFETKITDEKLKRLAENIYNRIGSLIARTQQNILQCLALPTLNHNRISQDDFHNAGVLSRGSLLQFYKKLKINPQASSRSLFVSSVLRNNLKLLPHAVAGEGEFFHNFLFMELKNEDIPWDKTQTDW